MKKFGKLALTFMLILGLVVLSGCGSNEAEKENKDAGSDKQEIVIGASLLTQQHPFYVSLKNAMEAEAKAQGVTLNVSIANQDLNKQISDIEDFITKGVDAIILSPVDSKGVTAAVNKAKAANIPVITVDIPAVGAETDAHVATDNLTGGKIAGEEMAKVLGGKGKVAVIDYPTVQSVIDRVTGFKESLAKYPDIQIVAIQPGITRPEALSAAQNMLQANGDLNGIFGFGDDAALAAVAAVKSAGKEDQVKVIGFDGMEEARNAVKSEKSFVAVITQYPDQMGKEGLVTALKILKGEQVEKVVPITPGVFTKEGERK
ncbi:substrate-binding domain-containing protein [Desulforamulus ruminis]|uniref:Periplasmic binding protein/LacI transcriptional regulator n=1 Tax=Desulforamulus ruminis (strain ATCC 23193 / DSM 2154 / NCIMB 8452 / DL) TaxID=696281 RepID=F6DQM7_DESRL|nr:substrate-binding domain-containing protein [Desulforamulus ruminis]AEG62024.1 periplasmic binding protein/LacI transcriptional regulator [Desulforamulus ruminis DSM 2154]